MSVCRSYDLFFGRAVLRDDGDRLLERPVPVSFLTAPAVNAGATRFNEPVTRARMENVLSLAVVQGHEVLVLVPGAWGCGVFGNEPSQVAGLSAEHLLSAAGRFARALRCVVFAVLDSTPDESTIRPFESAFGGLV